MLVCAVAIFAILLFVPLGEMIGWAVTYLLPVAVILGVITAVLALWVWVIERLLDPPYRDWMQ